MNWQAVVPSKRLLYTRKSEFERKIERPHWAETSDMTKEQWEEDERFIQEIESLHFKHNTGEDATELQKYISKHLSLIRDYWNVNIEDYRAIIEEFGTPLGTELSKLYFTMVESFSGGISSVDMKSLLDAFLDTGINGNIEESKYWRKELALIDERVVIGILENIPLSLTREFRLRVYLFFLRPFLSYTFKDFLPNHKIDTYREDKAKNWISVLTLLKEREEALMIAKEKNIPVKKQVLSKNHHSPLLLSIQEIPRIKQSYLIFALHESDRTWLQFGRADVARTLVENFTNEHGNSFDEKSMLAALGKPKPSKDPRLKGIDIEPIKMKIKLLFQR